MTKKQKQKIMDFLAWRWRTNERAKEAEELAAKGLPPKKYKKKAKAKFTEQEQKTVLWALDRTRNKGVWGDFFNGPRGDTEVNVIDSEFQKLDIRVGPVFQGNKMSRVPGIWIAYQEKAWLSPRQGEFLMSPSTFFEIVEDALEEIERFKPSAYRLNVKKLRALLKKTKTKTRRRL